MSNYQNQNYPQTQQNQNTEQWSVTQQNMQSQQMPFPAGFPESERLAIDPRYASSKNRGLVIVLVIVLTIAVMLAAFVVLASTGIIKFGSNSSQESNQKKSEVVSVNKTMYTKKDAVPLKKEPSSDSETLETIPMGNSVFVLEYVNDKFARVSFENIEGYVDRNSLSEEKVDDDTTDDDDESKRNKPIPVKKTMYVYNCNEFINLRKGPSTSDESIAKIPFAQSVYVIEYVSEDFAHVKYDGYEGYAARDYLSNTKPKIYDYDEYEVAAFVEDSLYAFVDGINRSDYSYLYEYFTDSWANKSLSSIKAVDDAVYREEILYVDCHSVKRVSPTSVTVIRESTIRVYYENGTTKDLDEIYEYTVDVSDDYVITSHSSLK